MPSLQLNTAAAGSATAHAGAGHSGGGGVNSPMNLSSPSNAITAVSPRVRTASEQIVYELAHKRYQEYMQVREVRRKKLAEIRLKKLLSEHKAGSATASAHVRGWELNQSLTR